MNSPVTIEVVTFDLDDTLWDVEPALLRAESAQRDWLLEHRPGTLERYDDASLWEFKKSVWQRHPELAHHVSKLRIQTLLELQLAAGYAEPAAQVGAETAFAVFLRHRHAVILYEEALEVLRELAQHYTLGALTNGNADIYQTEVGEYFNFAFLAEQVGASKPAPDMFHAALKETGVAAHCMVHVGDNPQHDIEGAKAAGLHTVWMNSRGQSWPGGQRADREISNLRQLPDALAQIAGGASAPG